MATLIHERSRRLPRPGRRFLLFVVTAILAAAAVAGGLATLHERQAGRIMPGVSAAGIQLGGLTPDEARAALGAGLADLSAGSISVRAGMGVTNIPFVDVGRVPDIDAMVAEAAALGRGGSWLDETVAAIRIQLRPEAVGLRLGYDPERAAAAIARFADRTALHAIDAAIVGGTREFVVTDAVEGHRIDAAATLAGGGQVFHAWLAPRASAQPARMAGP